MSKIIKVVGCKPTGSLVLLEHLTDQEMMGTSLTLPGKSKAVEVQQSYVRATGPSFDPTKWGYNIGDRVLVVGSYNPVPTSCCPANMPTGREYGIVEPHAVRGMLVEEAV